MTITIHKGTNEIGGSCIELSTQNTTILFDYGTPLNLASTKLDLKNKKIDAIVISHPHQDHFGEITTVETAIPIYCGKLSKELMNATKLFTGQGLLANKFHHFEAWKSFKIGDITITPYLVDHSAVDAYAFLVEYDGKKVIYSGDFRANGRKSKLFENMLTQKKLKNADVLLMEGTMLQRNNEEFPTEISVENKIVETLKNTEAITFMIGSSQNIDSLVSAYRACKKAEKIFVIDMYTAWILEKMSSVSTSIPTMDWKNVFVLKSYGGSYYEKIKKNRDYFGDFQYRLFSNVILLDDIQKEPSRYYVKISLWHIEKLLKKLDTSSANIIYSQWLGYLKPEFSDKKTVDLFKKLQENHNWVYAHTSGHADLESLKKFSEALSPKALVPIHTEHKDAFCKHFENTVVLEDGTPFII